MRSPAIYFIGLILLITSCGNEKVASDLDQAFIQSLKDGEFKTLEPYFPTRDVFRSVETDSNKKTEVEVDSILAQSNRRLKNGWDKIAATVKAKNIDPAKITIKEKILYNVFDKSPAQAMVVLYEYNGKTWDDLSFIVKEKNKTTYLLEIPNPADVFSFEDTSLREISLAKAKRELEKKDFQLALGAHVVKLVNWATDDNLKEFSAFVVYPGNNARSWKSAVNMADAAESKIAMGIMNKVKNVMKDCKGHEFGKIKGERESEGFWIIQPVNCGDKMVYFSFLKIKDKFLLGDIDTGEKAAD